MKRWTIMVYMAGDNNLSEDMVAELKGMQASMGVKDCDRNVNLVAVYDSGYFTVDTTIYRFTSSGAKKPLASCELRNSRTSAGSNSESPRLKDFVQMVANRPELKAEKYALIISGHSDGVMSKTMLRDNHPETIITLSHLGKTLKEAANSLGKNRKFDLLGFDSCLMGMLEVGYELRNAAEVMVASQGLTPAAGWPYNLVLQPLISCCGRMTALEFASSIVSQFSEYSKEFSVGGRSVNINASDLSGAEGVKKAIDGLGKFLAHVLDWQVSEGKEVSEEQAANFSVVRERILDLIHSTHYNSQTFMQEQAVDIRDFSEALESRCEQMKSEITTLTGGQFSAAAMLLWDVFSTIQHHCVKISAAADEYVVANCFSGPEYQFSKGVSVFFPWSYLAFNLIFNQYNELQFNRHGAWWKTFIERYTKHTVRPSVGAKFEVDTNFLSWVRTREERTIIDPGKLDAARQWTGRQWSGRQWTGKQWSGKGDMEEFYKLFGRFRNFPVLHDPVGCNE